MVDKPDPPDPPANDNPIATIINFDPLMGLVQRTVSDPSAP